MIELGPNLTQVLLATLAIVSLVVQGQFHNRHEATMLKLGQESNPSSRSEYLTRKIVP